MNNAFLSKYTRTQLLLSIYNLPVSILKHTTENNIRKNKIKIVIMYSFVMIEIRRQKRLRGKIIRLTPQSFQPNLSTSRQCSA